MAKHRKKRRTHRRRSHSYSRNRSYRRRSNPMKYMARRNYRRRRYSNPGFGGMPRGGELLWAGSGALLNGVLTRALPQTLVPHLNVGWAGYGLNILAGSVGAWGIGKFNKRAGQGAWIGMIVAVGQRIIAEKFGAGSAGESAGMSGDLDFDLGYYLDDPFPFQQGPAAGPYPSLPGTPYSGGGRFTSNAAAGPARMRQTAAIVAGTGAPVSVGPAGGGGGPWGAGGAGGGGPWG